MKKAVWLILSLAALFPLTACSPRGSAAQRDNALAGFWQFTETAAYVRSYCSTLKGSKNRECLEDLSAALERASKIPFAAYTNPASWAEMESLIPGRTKMAQLAGPAIKPGFYTPCVFRKGSTECVDISSADSSHILHFGSKGIGSLTFNTSRGNYLNVFSWVKTTNWPLQVTLDVNPGPVNMGSNMPKRVYENFMPAGTLVTVIPLKDKLLLFKPQNSGVKLPVVWKHGMDEVTIEKLQGMVH